MDYCHLTSDGIQIALSSVAEHIMRLFGKPGRSWSELKALAAAPTSKTMANASFLAANHNFNWGQGDEIVRYHCSNALRNDPEIARSMRHFIHFQTCGAPTLLCASFERFTQDNLIMIEYHLNPTHSEKQAKLPLINVMLDALNEMYPDLRDQTEELRKKEHAVTFRGVDLLKSYYSRSTYEDQRLASGQKLGYHRSLNIESRFFFICEAKSDIGFTITYRAPDEVTERDKVLLLVNNTYVEEKPATRRWRNAEITVPAEHVREGVNSITVRWPLPVLSWVDRINRTAERIDSDIAVSLRTIYHIYGEISTFKAFTKTDKR
jgi:hypothetical protein